MAYFGKQAKSKSTTTPALQRGIGNRLRENPKKVLAFGAGPQPPVRKPKASQKAKRTTQAPATSATGDQLERVAQSIEVPLAEGYSQVDHENDHYSDDEISLALRDTDPEEAFNRKWGYLPPLDEEVITLIEEIMADPGTAKGRLTIGPESPKFSIGLQYRNVLLQESAHSDPFVKKIEEMKPSEYAHNEKSEETKSHGELWDLDLKKCAQGSSEALFQRTVMMFLIARHCLIYKPDENSQNLDFSVEEPWTCLSGLAVNARD